MAPTDYADPDYAGPDFAGLDYNGDVNPVPAPLLRDSAYESIRDAIRYGALQPGEALSETRLSTWLGVSRTPVREALQRLARQGMVQIIPGRAVTVAAPQHRRYAQRNPGARHS